MRARWKQDNLMLTGILSIVALLIVSIVVFSGNIPNPFKESTRTLTAVFKSTNQLYPGADVRSRGITVGEVSEIAVNEGGRNATVEMEVTEDAFPLYTDARADIRFKLVLGGNVGIVLEPGTPAEGELAGLRIAEARTSNQVEVDDITAALQERQQTGLRTLIDETGDALGEREVLGDTLDAVADNAPGLERGLRPLRGTYAGELTDVVQSAARAVEALDHPRQLQALISGAATTLETTARREADIRSTLRATADTLPAATGTIARLDDTLGLADPLLAKLRAPVRDIAPTLAALQPVVDDGTRLLGRAQPLIRFLRPTATRLAAVADKGVPLLRGLRPSLIGLDEQVLPGLAKPNPTSGFAAYELAGAAVAGVNGAAAGFDRFSNLIRFPVSGGERAVDSLPCKSFFTDASADVLIRCQAIGDAIDRLSEGFLP